MKISDIPRNNLTAALAFLDQEFDAGRAISGDTYATLQRLQDDGKAFAAAANKHVIARHQAGKPVPQAR